MQDTSYIHINIGSGAEAEQHHVYGPDLQLLSPSLSSFLAQKIWVDANANRYVEIADTDAAAWKVLFAWQTDKRLPAFLDPGGDTTGDSHRQLLCQCWLLGEKWDIIAFQNDIMVRLLDVIKNVWMGPAVMQLVFGSSRPNSRLCLLMAEDIVRVLRHPRTRYTFAGFAEIPGLRDSIASVWRAASMTDDMFSSRVKESYLIGPRG